MNTRNRVLIGAVAALLAVGTSLTAKADDAMKPTTSSTIDYTVLIKQKSYDYTDLMQAKAAGYSDSQIATMAKIAHETYTPFTSILAAVQRGQTFASIADQYNLRLQDVYDVSDEKAKIADYMTAYEATGKMAMMH